MWYISGDTRIPAAILQTIHDPANEAYLSVVSVWEIMVKHQIGKLAMPQHPDAYVPQQRERHGIESLQLDEASVTRVAKLPPLHKDPFDRMLICQAVQQNLLLVSVDSAVRAYSTHVSILP